MKYHNYSFKVPLPEDANTFVGSGSYKPEELRVKYEAGEVRITGSTDALESLGRDLIILAFRHKTNKNLHEHYFPGTLLSEDSDELYVASESDSSQP